MALTKMSTITAAAISLLLSFSVPLQADQLQKTTVEKLLDILQEKGIITEKQYEELTEELGAEKKELEEQTKAVQEIQSREEKTPRVGY
jgi:DNA-directed RNA polymerase specialized sigma54-like protein